MPQKANKDDMAKQACGKWLGVRFFVQVFAFGGEDDGTKKLRHHGHETPR